MEDQEVVWGKPTLEEIKEYFQTPKTTVDPRSVFDIPSSDSSVELDDSFKTLLEERRKKIEAQSEKLAPRTPATSKKGAARVASKTSLQQNLEDTMSEEQSMWMKCSDDTFLDMERMCEASIVDSLIPEPSETSEADTIERLISECSENSRPQQGRFIRGFADMTQLNDVEAPSMMWEQTILHANSPKPSPVKMVGFLRPSTILEESSLGLSQNYSDSSKNQTAFKQLSETTTTEKFGNSLDITANLSGTTKSIDMLKVEESFCIEKLLEEAASTVERPVPIQSPYKALEQPDFASEESNAEESIQRQSIESGLEVQEQSTVEAVEKENVSIEDILGEHLVLEDSDEENLKNSSEQQQVEQPSKELENISDDLESEAGHISLNTTANESFTSAKGTIDESVPESKAPDSTTTSDNTVYRTASDNTLTSNASIHTLPDELNVFKHRKKRNFYDSMSNSSTISEDSLMFNVKTEKPDFLLDSIDVIEVSSKETTTQDDSANSTLETPKFNDTLEEMDFIMQHGMDILKKQEKLKPVVKNSPITPMHKNSPVLKQVNSNTKSRLFPELTPTSSSKTTPTTFKKPQAISRLPVFKSSAKKFENIVSPIHTYIKDCPQYPLIAKHKSVRTGLIDRLHDPNRRDTVYVQDENHLGVDSNYKPTLPMKGVISSTWKQEIDARTPQKIFGGEAMHKLLGNNTPTVVKHEGRYKSGLDAERELNADDTVDDSFVNLSIASADVSVRVVKNVNRV